MRNRMPRVSHPCMKVSHLSNYHIALDTVREGAFRAYLNILLVFL